jgi:phage host-nuclease inhibitor protein Gam
VARPRKASGELKSLAECTDAMRRLLLAVTRKERIQAERDETMARLFKTYEKDLTATVEEEKDLTLQLQQYYMAHLKECETDGRKSIELTYGIIGRRNSPASLKLLNKSWTWTAVLVKLREAFGAAFIRPRDPEIDKEAVKSGVAEADLALYGLKLEQEETFYVELTRAEQESA